MVKLFMYLRIKYWEPRVSWELVRNIPYHEIHVPVTQNRDLSRDLSWTTCNHHYILSVHIVVLDMHSLMGCWKIRHPMCCSWLSHVFHFVFNLLFFWIIEYSRNLADSNIWKEALVESSLKVRFSVTVKSNENQSVVNIFFLFTFFLVFWKVIK